MTVQPPDTQKGLGIDVWLLPRDPRRRGGVRARRGADHDLGGRGRGGPTGHGNRLDRLTACSRSDNDETRDRVPSSITSCRAYKRGSRMRKSTTGWLIAAAALFATGFSGTTGQSGQTSTAAT